MHSPWAVGLDTASHLQLYNPVQKFLSCGADCIPFTTMRSAGITINLSETAVWSVVYQGHPIEKDPTSRLRWLPISQNARPPHKFLSRLWLTIVSTDHFVFSLSLYWTPKTDRDTFLYTPQTDIFPAAIALVFKENTAETSY